MHTDRKSNMHWAIPFELVSKVIIVIRRLEMGVSINAGNQTPGHVSSHPQHDLAVPFNRHLKILTFTIVLQISLI